MPNVRGLNRRASILRSILVKTLQLIAEMDDKLSLGTCLKCFCYDLMSLRFTDKKKTELKEDKYKDVSKEDLVKYNKEEVVFYLKVNNQVASIPMVL